MEYTIMAFRSRAHTVKFYEILKSHGYYAEIINTPKEAGVGCGLSVKVKNNNAFSLRLLLQKSGLNSFAGLFLVKDVGFSRIVRPIK